jgi:hypothetical protein
LQHFDHLHVVARLQRGPHQLAQVDGIEPGVDFVLVYADVVQPGADFGGVGEEVVV